MPLRKTVLVINRPLKELKESERLALQSRYGTKLVFKRQLGITNLAEFRAACEKLNPFAVLLPPESEDSRTQEIHKNVIAWAIHSKVLELMPKVLILALAHDKGERGNFGLRLGKLRSDATDHRSPDKFEFNF